MKPEELIRIRYEQEWWENVSIEGARPYHARNVQACRDAVAWHEKKDRPLNILALHGSGRANFASCAHELSNSQILLRSALQQFEGKSEYEVTELALRSYAIEPCNNCLGSSSVTCGFPCDCFPLDGMQKLYPLVLKCDAMFFSTGVNQSNMSTRQKAFADRLISLDGGFFRERLEPKDHDFKGRTIGLAVSLAKRRELPYDARMWGRAAAYFITSKDQANESETVARPFETPLNYIELTAHTLRDGYADFGFFHDETDWFAGAWANPDEEYAFDKRHFAKHPEFARRAALVARKAVELAKRLRENPPPFDGGGRGRTRT